jgi:DNA-binding NarL/FixJ family response regulator
MRTIEGLTTMTERAVLSQRPTGGDQEALKILVADAHPLMRDGLAKVLPGLAERVEVLQVDSLQGALAGLAAHPDTALALLELVLPDGEGTQVLERVREARPEIPVVVVSGSTDQATVRATIQAGARGFISKRSAPPVLLSALRLVLAGEVYVPPEVLRTQLLAPQEGAPSGLAPSARRGKEPDLTKRQLDVLALLVQGKPNKVICRELGLAEGTVKAHTAAIFRALRVSNRTEAGFAVNCLGIRIPQAVRPGTSAPHAAERLLVPA